MLSTHSRIKRLDYSENVFDTADHLNILRFMQQTKTLRSLIMQKVNFSEEVFNKYLHQIENCKTVTEFIYNQEELSKI